MLWRMIDIGFFVFHTLWMVFNLVGWIFRRTRRWNLATLVLTGLSWFGLGACCGWGYCVCTDWHWAVRRRLGYGDASASYVHFLILKLTGFDLLPAVVDVTVVAAYFVCLLLSLYLNLAKDGVFPKRSR